MSEVSAELVNVFLQLSVKEWEEKNFGSTGPYLEVLEIVQENGSPVITRVEQLDNGNYAVYFPVKNENFSTPIIFKQVK